MFPTMSAIPKASPRGKILVVDDNPIIQRTMYFALRDQGYTVLMAGEISEALKIIRQEQPDLILLDLNFPPDGSVGGGGGHDGFWALDWMRRTEEINRVPIVIISGDDPATTEPRARAAGAVGYLHKPIGKDQLARLVAELLAQKQSAAAPPPAG
jgi:CheY-like chemotaxis protein